MKAVEYEQQSLEELTFFLLGFWISWSGTHTPGLCDFKMQR